MGKKRKFEEFEDLTIENGFTRRVKSLLEDKYLMCHPLSSSYAANMLCPSLAILTLHVENPSKYTVSDVGFVVDCKDDVTTIWGQSFFLYGSKTPPNNLTNLQKGKLSVTIQSLQFCEKPFDGMVTYIDFDLNLLVVKIKTPNSPNIPISNLGSFSKFNHLIDKSIWFDLFSCGQRYEKESYTFAVPDVYESGSCQTHRHVKLNNRFVPGVLFNSDLEVIGMKMSVCNINRELAHVLRIEDISRSLDLHTHRSDFTDLLATEEKVGSTSGGDSVVEELQRKVEEANTRFEAALSEHAELRRQDNARLEAAESEHAELRRQDNARLEAAEGENAQLRAQVRSLQSFQATMELFIAGTLPPARAHGR